MNDHTSAETTMAFKDRSVRASVILHEEQLRAFLDVWSRAKVSGVGLPAVADPDYASYEALRGHVFRWAGTYLTWTCENLALPDPNLKPQPSGGYAEHLLEAWRTSLLEVPGNRLADQTYTAPWGAQYCIDAMLEHAVMHPIKHRFQLEELMGERR